MFYLLQVKSAVTVTTQNVSVLVTCASLNRGGASLCSHTMPQTHELQYTAVGNSSPCRTEQFVMKVVI